MIKKVVTALSLLLSLTCLSSCGLFDEQEEEANDFETKSQEIYRMAVQNGYTGTYEEWLESIKGEQGPVGPKGEDGHSPVLTIGVDGNWYIDGQNTNIKASGNDGTQGEPGVGILDIQVSYKTIEGVNKICFEFLMSDGTTKVRYLDTTAPDEEVYTVADYYDGYYTSLTSWTNSEDLITKLHNIISGGTYYALKYDDPNWETNSYADQDLYDHEMLDVVYSSNSVAKSNTQKGWQREHAFCASLMCGSNTGDAVKFVGRSTDFHNLFAGESAGNMSRGNKNFGVANKQDPSYTDRTTNNGEDGYSYDSLNFEPGNKDKGRLSRAIYYMTVMYNQEVVDTKNNVTLKPLKVVDEYVTYTAGNCQFAIGNGQDLLEWAHNDVDLLEYQHNESVYSHLYNGHAQGNRNPFVDYPDLIDYCFGNKKDLAGELKYLKPTAETLGTNKTNEVSHYAIKEAKRDYKVGETVTKDDVSLVKVYKDLHEENLSIFSMSPTLLTEAKTYEISVPTPLNTINYNVTALETTPFDNADEIVTLEASKFKQTGDVTNISFYSGDYIRATLSCKNLNGTQNNANGVKFGTSSNPVSDLEIKLDLTLPAGKLVKAIAIKANPSSGKTFTMLLEGMTCDINSQTITYSADGSQIYTYTMASTVVEIPSSITLKASNITSAIYIHSIALVLE